MLLNLTRVTTLNFTGDHRFNPCFGEFFSCLPSVETMYTDLRTLSHLGRLHTKYASKATKGQSILFPVLKVIDLGVHRRSSKSTFSINRAVMAFLRSRLQEGHPVATLGMSNHLPLRVPPNLDALAEVKGLAVLHKLSAMEDIVQHTGGSEDREKTIDTF